MKISLLYPRWTEDYGIFAHFAKKASCFPPLNLAYIASAAENKGHEVRIIDGQVENKSLEKIINDTIEFNPDIVGITATTPFFHFAEDLAKHLKDKTNIPITIGGPHITILKDKAFKDCFDYGFLGEAEDSFPLFLEAYEKNKDISNVKGILYREDGKVKSTGNAEPIQDINSLPFPARHLLKTDKYQIGTLRGTKNFTSLMTTRGCPFKCIFCSTEVFGHNVRKRSPKAVVDEIKYVKNNHGIEHFFFLDDNLTLNKKHTLEICDLIEKEKLGITFEGGTRANLVDEEIISKMAKAGLIRIGFGLESVDENIRRIMKKEVPLESYKEANKLTNKYGIETLNSCIIGMPGETIDTVKETLKFLRQSREIKDVNMTIAVPYPGTELYEMAKKGEYGLKLMTDDFSKYRRYNTAVISNGDLSPKDLVDVQNEAYASIYLPHWRWKPMIKKSGLFGAALTFKRLAKCLVKGKTRFLTNKQLGVY